MTEEAIGALGKDIMRIFVILTRSFWISQMPRDKSEAKPHRWTEVFSCVQQLVASRKLSVVNSLAAIQVVFSGVTAVLNVQLKYVLHSCKYSNRKEKKMKRYGANLRE